MDKKQREHFKKLFKVKLLRDMVKIEEEEGWKGNVTRQSKFDNERTIRLIEYGFKEGIKFANEGKGEGK